MEKTREEILELTEEIFFIFMEHLSESDAKNEELRKVVLQVFYATTIQCAK